MKMNMLDALEAEKILGVYLTVDGHNNNQVVVMRKSVGLVVLLDF